MIKNDNTKAQLKKVFYIIMNKDNQPKNISIANKLSKKDMRMKKYASILNRSRNVLMKTNDANIIVQMIALNVTIGELCSLESE